MREPLPIDEHLPAIVRAVRERRAAVVVAPPGAGKTTRVPPALLPLGSVILLQPRRVAARSLARRIAEEQGFTIGEEIGWQVRFERRFGPATRLLVATEGILTARLQADPLLSGFAVAVIDEFHERGIHGDLGLALVRQAALAREDLRIVVMSATLEAERVAEFLGGCPIVEVAGRTHPVTIEHAPSVSPAAAVREIVRREGGHVLVFLPGAPEIRRVERELQTSPLAAAVLPLHGSLDADAQDRALAPSSRRKIILATNLAETSLTVEGVTDVVDSGLQKVLRYDAALGLDRLETERIARDSAAQRAGRAGRTGPGRVLRLYDPREILREHREPEISRVDLAAPFLEVLAWGADPRSFAWFEPPPAERAVVALELLEALGAVLAGRITPLGESLRRFPLPPRLARVLVEAGGTRQAAAVCALLENGSPDSDADVLASADAIATAPEHVRRAADELASLAARVLGRVPAGATEERLLRALLAGYPDRVARRRETGSPKLVLASGHGATLRRESGSSAGEWLVALDVVAAPRGPGSEALVRAASRIERAWLAPTRLDVEHEMRDGVVRAFERSFYGALVLSERAVPPDASEAARLVAAEIRARGLGERESAFLRRIRFARIAWDENAWIERSCAGHASVADVDLLAHVPFEVRRELDRNAPETIPTPAGRRARLEYRDDGAVTAAVKLQHLFGLEASPRIGPDRVPVTFFLLAPSGRPVQTTSDLASFWERIYPEVRRELRGRYPKHAWPEDPRRGA